MELLEQFSAEDREIFKRQIEDWKDEYYGAVYVTEIGDISFIWRGLSRAEFKKANDYFIDDYERAEYVCRQCVLYPFIEDYSIDMFAGIPETLTGFILKESGFTMTTVEIDNQIFQYEQEMRTFDNQISCVIKEAFSDISIEEIENWQFEKTLWYYSRAKWILENLRGVTLEKEEAQEIQGLPPKR